MSKAVIAVLANHAETIPLREESGGAHRSELLRLAEIRKVPSGCLIRSVAGAASLDSEAPLHLQRQRATGVPQQRREGKGIWALFGGLNH